MDSYCIANKNILIEIFAEQQLHLFFFKKLNNVYMLNFSDFSFTNINKSCCTSDILVEFLSIIHILISSACKLVLVEDMLSKFLIFWHQVESQHMFMIAPYSLLAPCTHTLCVFGFFAEMLPSYKQPSICFFFSV